MFSGLLNSVPICLKNLTDFLKNYIKLIRNSNLLKNSKKLYEKFYKKIFTKRENNADSVRTERKMFCICNYNYNYILLYL